MGAVLDGSQFAHVTRSHRSSNIFSTRSLGVSLTDSGLVGSPIKIEAMPFRTASQADSQAVQKTLPNSADCTSEKSGVWASPC